MYIFYYFKEDRKKTRVYYEKEITRIRDVTDRPVEEVIDEYHEERVKYTLKQNMFGKKHGPFYF
jgi:hypothetical protein